MQQAHICMRSLHFVAAQAERVQYFLVHKQSEVECQATRTAPSNTSTRTLYITRNISVVGTCTHAVGLRFGAATTNPSMYVNWMDHNNTVNNENLMVFVNRAIVKLTEI